MPLLFLLAAGLAIYFGFVPPEPQLVECRDRETTIRVLFEPFAWAWNIGADRGGQATVSLNGSLVVARYTVSNHVASWNMLPTDLIPSTFSIRDGRLFFDSNGTVLFMGYCSVMESFRI